MSVLARPTTFELDEKAVSEINRLKPILGERTNVGVVRKALALLAEAVDSAQGQGYFTLESPNGDKIKVRLL